MGLSEEIISEFNRFFKRARECGEQEPTAMVLATSDGKGLVTSRTVLLKALDERRERIAEGLAASDKAEKELEAAKLTVEEQIREARDKAGEIVDQANQRHTQIVDQVVAAVVAAGGGRELQVDALLERLALVMGHGDEKLALVRLADLVDGADLGMIQGRGRLGLMDEPLLLVLVGVQVLGQELQGHGLPEGQIIGPVDLSHSAAPENPDHPIPAGENRASRIGAFVDLGARQEARGRGTRWWS